jgi:PAS domain S-box-containing protein
MTKQKPSASDKDRGRRLRAAAEAKLARHPAAPLDPGGKAAGKLLHELQVHQIELEMQNEELKRAQEALEESRDKYLDLYDFAPVGYFTLTRTGHIAEANLAGAAMLGVGRPRLVRRGLAGFVAPEDVDRWGRHLASVLKSAEKAGAELTLRRGDGSTFYARLDSVRLDRPAPEAGDGQAGPAIRVAMSDISDRKQAEELRHAAILLERSNKDLEQFAFVASHDLQEPLRQVVSFTNLLRNKYKGKLDDTADEYIEYAVNGAQRMSNLIRDLLAYARVDARGGPAGTIACQEALDTALVNLDVVIAESGARVTHDGLPAVVADKTRLTQLFQNLVGNAIKFRRPGLAPRIHVGAKPDGDQWVLSVRDNGIGIAADQYERVFGVFQRLHPIDTYPGTGIGLAICRKIVERHGGRIWVESTVGEGTTFYFSMPASDLGGKEGGR